MIFRDADKPLAKKQESEVNNFSSGGLGMVKRRLS
ncbi:hypothetical protein SAMN05216411_102324 [Nitrosospira multiformis]|nr:hypothetical protein SAMN05216411_102324 [Nitrosospira multiformis]